MIVSSLELTHEQIRMEDNSLRKIQVHTIVNACAHDYYCENSSLFIECMNQFLQFCHRSYSVCNICTKTIRLKEKYLDVSKNKIINKQFITLFSTLKITMWWYERILFTYLYSCSFNAILFIVAKMRLINNNNNNTNLLDTMLILG